MSSQLPSTHHFAPAPEPATELGRYRVLCPAGALRVSPLCLGGMSIGEAWKDYMGSMSKEASFKLLDAFREAGGNFIDTSNNYQYEESEKWIGEWMAARGNRNEIVLATKFASDWRAHEIGKGKGPNYAGNNRKSIHMSVHASLEKLQTDYIDILYLHWWDWTTSIREVMDGLHVLVEQGKVLYLGASDTPAWVVSAANEYALARGKTPFCIYQGKWNIMTRDLEREVLPMARTYSMAIAPWDVLGSGRLQSKKGLEERRAQGERMRSFMGAHEQTEEEVRFSEALEKVAREHGTDSVAQIALAYIRSKAPHVFPIVGGRKVEHLHDNIKALSIRLSDEQIAFLESVKPFDLGFPTAFLGEDPNVVGSSYRLNRAAQTSFPHATRRW